MNEVPSEKVLYNEIQTRLIYLIPEKWESIHLYASIIDSPNQKSVGEMFFYYFPKGILKKKPINCYEIPGLFDIEEDEFLDLINKLFGIIKKLRYSYYKAKKKVWYEVNIKIENSQFKIEYGFTNLAKIAMTSYERHLVWRFENLGIDIKNFDKKEKQIIGNYLENIKPKMKKKLTHIEGIYKLPNKSIIDYERVLTVDEAIERQKAEHKLEEKRAKKEMLAKQKQEKKLAKKNKNVVASNNNESQVKLEEKINKMKATNNLQAEVKKKKVVVQNKEKTVQSKEENPKVKKVASTEKKVVKEASKTKTTPTTDIKKKAKVQTAIKPENTIRKIDSKKEISNKKKSNIDKNVLKDKKDSGMVKKVSSNKSNQNLIKTNNKNIKVENKKVKKDI